MLFLGPFFQVPGRFYGLKEFLKFQSINSLRRSQVNFWGIPTNPLGKIEEIKDKNFGNFKTIIQITEIPMDFHVNYFLQEKNIHENIENKESLELENSYENYYFEILTKSNFVMEDIFESFDTEKKFTQLNILKISSKLFT